MCDNKSSCERIVRSYFRKNTLLRSLSDIQNDNSGNGKCILVGEKNTAHIGHFEKQLTKEEVTSIFTDLKNAGYDTLQEKYLSRATDLPMTIYSLTENGKTKSVKL